MIIKGRNVLFLLLLGISGCNPFMIFRPTSEQITTQGWAKDDPHKKHQPPLYCYNTLGETVCHTAPRQGGNKRLRGYYGPTP